MKLKDVFKKLMEKLKDKKQIKFVDVTTITHIIYDDYEFVEIFDNGKTEVLISCI
ncbi:hypothetical protein [Francisella tularensis]|uniref:hypothetical protein n=1 Tax=Francisella tularensis TaxID=263 RepID=UPI0008F60B89|nr:hypothetical protein [Francisella tularensis]APA83265.1 hypothetical protein N894_1281 [Francisella tularensis subsp. novicida PA10-7858]